MIGEVRVGGRVHHMKKVPNIEKSETNARKEGSLLQTWLVMMTQNIRNRLGSIV